MRTHTVAAENTPPPFDEEAALAELDRLREDIQAARRNREKKVEEFESWMQETRNTARVERISAIEQEKAGVETAAAARAANRATDPATQTSGLAAAPAAQSSQRSAPLEDEFPFDTPRARRPIPIDRRWAYYGGGVAVLIVGGLLLGKLWGGRPEETPRSAPAQTAPAPSTSATARGAAPQTAATPRKPIEIELTTTRSVWMRVTVDGERKVEREVPGGQRLAFGADKVILLRAGDGGGVRLAVGGKDQGLLGRDGQIAVRTFTR